MSYRSFLDRMGLSGGERHRRFRERLGIGTSRSFNHVLADAGMGDQANSASYQRLLSDIGCSPSRGEECVDELLDAGSFESDAAFMESHRRSKSMGSNNNKRKVSGPRRRRGMSREERRRDIHEELLITIAEAQGYDGTPNEGETLEDFIERISEAPRDWSDQDEIEESDEIDGDADDDDESIVESEDGDGTLRIVESVSLATSARIDSKTGIIRAVKLLGWESKNRRRYSRNAGKDAVKLYEGATVNMDHGAAADTNRGVVEGVGVIRNPRLESGGVYGDFCILLSHPYGPSIIERAERMPHTMGFSHAVDAKGRRGSDGVYEIESLTKVHSLDLVTRPATTAGLFESEQDDDSDGDGDIQLEGRSLSDVIADYEAVGKSSIDAMLDWHEVPGNVSQ